MMDLQFTLDFLKDLAQNNHKEWMDDNKKRYLEAKSNVIELVDDVITKVSSFDPSISTLEPKKCLFRINRDIRFSKNKDPYKTNFGAFLVEGGKKSGNPGYYIHIQPGNNFLGGGIYQPPSETLQKVRQEIDYNGKELKSIINDKTFSETYPEPHSADSLKTAPKGYPKDHEHIELLQLKHYVFMRQATDKEVTSKGFPENVARDFKVLFPFNQFLSKSLD
ncbi:DUF2461 domain-containing protein [Ekhidna sp.]|uniref:DUF2461 domain-containing protein n=1 Tax=Ekhidna sp. TaxID=2608089 RepID=UPI003CCC1C28